MSLKTNLRSTSTPWVIFILSIAFPLMAFSGLRDPLAKSLEALNTYITQFTPEKIYIATDRPYYAAGEIMWFKAWLVNGVDHKTDSPSRMIYADLIAPDGEIVLSRVLKSENGGVAGDFYLPTYLQPGEYTLRAYTNWMKNFDHSWMYRRTIRILRPESDQTQPEIRVISSPNQNVLDVNWVVLRPDGSPLTGIEVELSLMDGQTQLERAKITTDTKGNFTWRVNVPNHRFSITPEVGISYRSGREQVQYRLSVPELSPIDIQFMPEGGSFIAGVQQRVAFKAVDGLGRGIDVSGNIVDEQGQALLRFDTEYRGMGSFVISPEYGKKYVALLTSQNYTFDPIQLPEVSEYGISLNVDQSDPEDVIINIQSVGLFTDVTLIGHTRGAVFFSGVAAASANGFVAKIHRQDVKPGISHITVFDANGRPMAERLIFTPPNPRGTIQLLTDKQNYSKRSLVELDIAYLDLSGKPIGLNASVTVVKDSEFDATFEDRSDIRSYLLLTSDLRGLIETPSYYMSLDPKIQEHADLLMMTQGWRRFVWLDMMNGRFPEITHFVDDGVRLSGTLVQRSNQRSIRDEELSIAINPNDNPSYYTVMSDTEGRFSLDGLEVMDSTLVLFQADDRGGRRAIDVRIDKGYTPQTDAKRYSSLKGLPLSAIQGTYARNAGNRLAIDRSYGLSNEIRNLGEIVIEAKSEANAQQQPQYNRIYGNPDRYFIPTDSDVARGGTVFDFLRGRTGAFRFSGSGGNVRVTSARSATLTSTTTPLFFLDGLEVDASVLARLGVQNVGVVDILTEVSSTVIFGARGSNGVISVFTRKGEIPEPPKSNAVTKRIPGYYAVRKFYAPNYSTSIPIHSKPDTRTTLWWEHTIIPDPTGLAKVRFYTSDEPGVYRIRIEGIDADGVPLSKETTITVQ
jgi:hypothetical protein